MPPPSPRTHLSPPESQTLYEVCYYSSSATVRRHLNATPRTSIQAALSSPYYYLQVHSSWSGSVRREIPSVPLFLFLFKYYLVLQNERLKMEDGSVSSAAPDICIAYKLHLECGRLINLYDWLEVSLSAA